MTAIIIFTKNEEKIISQLIDELRLILKTLPSYKFELFLSDDSTDKTREIAKSKGLPVISGKGSLGWSYYFALNYVLKRNFENIVTLDGDGQTDLSEIPIFLQELKKGFDLIVGSRFLCQSGLKFPYFYSVFSQKTELSQKMKSLQLKRENSNTTGISSSTIFYSYSKWNFIGVKILSFIISFCSFQKFTDSHGGLRAMKSHIVRGISFLGTHSYVQETIISVKSQGFKVKELVSKWNPRPYGESRVVYSKIRYIKEMALPLLLRMRMHFIFSGLFLVAFLLLQNPVYLGLAVLFGLFELYKKYLYIKNKNQLKIWINAK